MGRRILVRRRGRGGMQFRAPRKGKIAAVRYPFTSPQATVVGEVANILHERGRSAPLMQVRLSDGSFVYLPAVAGISVGSKIEIGSGALAQQGNVLPLNKIPEGTPVCNIEQRYGDGGKLVRSSGASATLFSLTPSGAVVRLPSGKSTILSGDCRATIGAVAGSGRIEKPFLRAGTRFHALRAKGKMYPRVRGVAMSAVHHPFGGGRHQTPGKSTSTSRGAPPGRKVGLIAPRMTGRSRLRRQARRRMASHG